MNIRSNNFDRHNAFVLVGFFARDAGQFFCVNCDNVGDVYQESPGATSCEACPSNTVRYIGVLNSANRSSCQCKESEHLSRFFPDCSQLRSHYSTAACCAKFSFQNTGGMMDFMVVRVQSVRTGLFALYTSVCYGRRPANRPLADGGFAAGKRRPSVPEHRLVGRNNLRCWRTTAAAEALY